MNNRDAILTAAKPFFAKCNTLLEIGSGTGQHAVYFAEHLAHLYWQTSDLIDNHEGINEWINDSELDNIGRPFTLDVNQPLTHPHKYDGLFTANTLHIMDMASVENLLEKSAQLITEGGLLMIYGPFKYEGQFTSESNERFEQWLKATDERRGIRDVEVINALLKKQGFSLKQDINMPANNQLIVWELAMPVKPIPS